MYSLRPVLMPHRLVDLAMRLPDLFPTCATWVCSHPTKREIDSLTYVRRFRYWNRAAPCAREINAAVGAWCECNADDVVFGDAKARRKSFLQKMMRFEF